MTSTVGLILYPSAYRLKLSLK